MREIIDIISNTLKSKSEPLTIKAYLNLNDGDVAKLANDIYGATFGNPRNILKCLRLLIPGENEKWTAKFFNSIVRKELQVKAEALLSQILLNVNEAKYLYEECINNRPVNMDKNVNKESERKFEENADKLCFYWDGDKEKATLYLHDDFRPYFEAIPLKYDLKKFF